MNHVKVRPLSSGRKRGSLQPVKLCKENSAFRGAVKSILQSTGNSLFSPAGMGKIPETEQGLPALFILDEGNLALEGRNLFGRGRDETYRP